ncbi:hypothetical protein MRB53_004530 [Persea americana]|uniref:Uncharacterized protein n=1 Tax=Persea americana TaxID=3435 RepID=A0ACC2MC98_PERAE|nr:hypothetical protein MRB53_004530 [Persea americana]
MTLDSRGVSNNCEIRHISFCSTISVTMLHWSSVGSGTGTSILIHPLRKFLASTLSSVLSDFGVPLFTA